jgi:F-type H+-transporting ATPase subunit c
MNEYAVFFHYALTSSMIILPTIGISFGQRLIALKFMHALNRQPTAHNALSRMVLLSMALNETAAIICVLLAFLLATQMPATPFAIGAEIGIILATAAPALFLGILSSFPAQAALQAVSRQPFIATSITNVMLITQAMIQTPIIFGLINSIFIRSQFASMTSWIDSVRVGASGLALFLGIMGPVYGLALFAATICSSMGRNRHAQNVLQTFTFIGSGLIETPVFFAFIISFMLIAFDIPSTSWVHGFAYLAAAITIGLGTLGAGIGSGKTAAATAEQIAANPQLYSLLSRTSIMAQGLIDTAPVYAILVALALIFNQ